MSDTQAIRQVRALLAAHRVKVGAAMCGCGQDYGMDCTVDQLTLQHEEHQAHVLLAWVKLP